jgi:phosphoribosyl-AMP cyclohydrolase
MTTLDPQVAALLKDPNLLIPAVVQDASSKEVLMLAYMNAQSLQLTLTTGKATYWSRSRNELWIKGQTSGHFQEVQSISLDCDGDAVLLHVIQTGVACHTGERTCFHTPLELRSPQ